MNGRDCHTHTHCGLDLSWAEKKCPRTRVDVCQWNELGIHRRQIQFRWGEEDFWGPGKKFVYSACREYISTSANARFCSVHKFIYNTGWPGSGMGAVHDDIPIKSSAVFVLHVFCAERRTMTRQRRYWHVANEMIELKWTGQTEDATIRLGHRHRMEVKRGSVISIPDGW